MRVRFVATLAIVVMGSWVASVGVIGAQTLPAVAVTSATSGAFTFESAPGAPPCSFLGNYIVSTPAQFLLTRTGDITATLTVDIAWSGSATEGTVVAPTSIEFAAGSATATVTPTFTPTPSPN
ncbi:MAG: hypothetical protein ACXVRW_11275, partial [Solirubrobacteraceae bacterium]